MSTGRKASSPFVRRSSILAAPLLLVLPALLAARPLGAVTITRGPYLQDATPSGIVIMWQTDIPADPTVRFGLASTTELAVTDPALVRTHEVALTGLQPGTVYLYRVESSDGSSAVSSSELDLVTAPSSPSAPVRFAAIGDTGGPTVTSALSAKILADSPDLTIHAGDIQYGDPADPASWDTYYFNPGASLWAHVPSYPVLGNHEYPSSQSPAATPQLFLDYFSLPGDERFYSFDYGCVHFVALDVYQQSDAPDNWYLTAAQRSWLVSDLSLAVAAGRPWTVVYLHHPVYSSSSRTSRPWQAPFQADLVPIFEAHGVDYVVMGHDHIYSRSNRNGITYVVSGGGGASLNTAASNPFSVNPNHHRAVASENEYALFDATQTRMTMVVKKTDGTVIDRETKSNVRRNLILFLGDGMGFEHVQAGRLHVGGSDAVPRSASRIRRASRGRGRS